MSSPSLIRVAAILALVFVAIAVAAFAQGSSVLPRGFATTTAAVKAGCRSAAVKGPTSEACVLADTRADPMSIGVYERTPAGAYAISHEMAITSWSWDAKLSLLDVLGSGTDWLIIDTPGMHGTGIAQRVLLVIGWDGTRFRTAAAESLAYRCSRPTAKADYKLAADYKFATTNGERTLELKHELTRDTQRIGAWSDSLRWDAARFAFVPFRSTVDLANPIVEETRRKIARVREYSETRPLDLVQGSSMWIEDSGLMNVLDPACSQ